jgi:hypothetical protein
LEIKIHKKTSYYIKHPNSGLQAGDVAQCLACVRSWVRSSALKKKPGMVECVCKLHLRSRSRRIESSGLHSETTCLKKKKKKIKKKEKNPRSFDLIGKIIHKRR